MPRPDRTVTVFIETVTTRTAKFSVAELARITGETEQDIQANIDQGTFGAWVLDYLAPAPLLSQAVDAAPGVSTTTSDPDVYAVIPRRVLPGT